MSKANELTHQILSFLYENNVFAWRNNTTGIFDRSKNQFRTSPKKGVSDILACYNGKFLAIEIKIPPDRLSPEQEGFLLNIQHFGGLTFIAKDFNSFRIWFNSIKI